MTKQITSTQVPANIKTKKSISMIRIVGQDLAYLIKRGVVTSLFLIGKVLVLPFVLPVAIAKSIYNYWPDWIIIMFSWTILPPLIWITPWDYGGLSLRTMFYKRKKDYMNSVYDRMKESIE